MKKNEDFTKDGDYANDLKIGGNVPSGGTFFHAHNWYIFKAH